MSPATVQIAVKARENYAESITWVGSRLGEGSVKMEMSYKWRP